MPIDSILEFTEELIRIRSYSGQEGEALQLMESRLWERGWEVERLAVGDGSSGSFNLLASCGTPTVLFVTHLDVVGGPDFVFQPERRADRLCGRGACDAKGIAATMLEAATELKNGGAKDIALLFLIDEEGTSIGAKSAAPILNKRGVKFLVNGEPTDCFLVSGHKGVLSATVKFSGCSAHSGYPELGIDANATLIRYASQVLAEDFGQSQLFGNATVNLGKIAGGIGLNVISPGAELGLSLRLVTPSAQVIARLRELLPSGAKLTVLSLSEPMELSVIDGFKTKTVSYGTDISYLKSCGASCFLYGPGSITTAHTDNEFVLFSEIEQAYIGYKKLYDSVR